MDNRASVPSVPPSQARHIETQLLITHKWNRAQIQTSKAHVMKLSDVRGWSILCESPGAHHSSTLTSTLDFHERVSQIVHILVAV